MQDNDGAEKRRSGVAYVLANLIELYIVWAILASIAFGFLEPSGHYIAKSVLKGLIWPYSVVMWDINNG